MKYKSDDLGVVAKRTGVAFHHQLYTLLLRALGDGAISPGSALPTETELMARFAVSRNTVRRALARLEDEKRIVRRRGSGSYARNNPEQAFSPEVLAAVLRKFEDARSQTKAHLIRIAEAKTPEYIRRSEPAFGEECVVVQRWRSFNGHPFLFTTSHVPKALGARLNKKQLGQASVLLALVDSGVKVVSAEQTTTAILADSVAAKILRTEVAVPLVSVQRLIRDADSHPVEYQNHIYHPERFTPRANVSVQTVGRGDRAWVESAAEPNFTPWL